MNSSKRYCTDSCIDRIDWSLPPSPGLRVVPDVDCTLAATLRDPKRAGIAGMTSGAGAMVAAAMRVVNAVPYVVAAQPSLLSSADLPLTIPRNAFVAQGV
jgi:2,4-diaminopentanoate dehydrogenase